MIKLIMKFRINYEAIHFNNGGIQCKVKNQAKISANINVTINYTLQMI